MTNPGSTKLLVRMLKGAPLSCLFALALADGPVQVSWLCRMTGYSPHPVTEALKILAETGLAQPGKQRSNWQITPQARELFAVLMANGEANQPPEIRENRDSESATATTAIKNINHINLTTAVVAAFKTAFSEMGLASPLDGGGVQPQPPGPAPGGQSARSGQPAGKKRPGRSRRSTLEKESTQPRNDSPQPPAEVLKALHQAGIYEPTAGELARMPHVTLEYVQAHARKAQREQITIGLLIHRIRSQDPLPQKSNQHNRYISGEYAEFINH